MTLPGYMLDLMWDQWIETKRTVVELGKGPTPIGLRFMMAFGRDFVDWPFYSKAKALSLGYLGDGDIERDNLLAVFDTNNDREEIVESVARLMSLFGPPEWAGVLADSYQLAVPLEERGTYFDQPYAHGDLERDYNENPNTKVREGLTMEAFHTDGDHEGRSVLFTYNDHGAVVFEETRIEKTLPVSGFMCDLLQKIVALHDHDPLDIIMMLAEGDLAVALEIIRIARSDEN